MKLIIHHKILLYLVFVLLTSVALFFSFKYETVGTTLSILGSIASLYAIIEALVRIKSITEETKSIKEALSDKIEAMNLNETTEQINKHIEVISRIHSYIGRRNHDAVVILMEQLLVFLRSLNCNPTTKQSDVEEIQRFLKLLKVDLNNVRIITGDNLTDTRLNYKLLTKHFTDLEDFLTQVSLKNHFRDGQ